MKKLNAKHPVYSQMKALVADGDGPWRIAAINRAQARNAQSSLSQIGSLSGVRYTTSLKNLVVTVERVTPEPACDVTPVYEDGEERTFEIEFSPQGKLKSIKASQKAVMDHAITDCERKIQGLSTELRIQEAILKALIEVRDAPLF